MLENEKLKLREKANIERYICKNSKACEEAILQLYEGIPDSGGVFKHLFRYRSLDSYELKSLENETIFMRWPSSYKDGSDCTPVLDFEEINKYIIKKNYSFLDTGKVFNSYIKVNDVMKDPRIIEKINAIRDMNMIACFTERYDNDKMWKQYANNNSGICLVYNFLDVLKTIYACNGMSIMPVRYVDDRNNCKELLLNHEDLINYDDESDAKSQLTCTTKEKKYAFEEEWRLIYERERKDTDGKKEGDSIPFINPMLIICGDSVDKASEEYKKLINIAGQKDIKVIQK